jgi:hypothetical protein
MQISFHSPIVRCPIVDQVDILSNRKNVCEFEVVIRFAAWTDARAGLTRQAGCSLKMSRSS